MIAGAEQEHGQVQLYALAALAAAGLSGWEDPSVTALAVLALAILPWVLLVLRYRLPLWLFIVLALAPPAYLLAAGGSAVLFLVTVAVSRVASSNGRWLVVAPVTALATLMPWLNPAFRADYHAGGVYFAFGIVFGALVGVLLRRQTALTAQLRQAQRQLSAGAATAERHRIARDVHDIVGHSLTVVVLHVAGARRLVRTEPATAEQALADAERIGRESLEAMREVVGLLREDSGAAAAQLAGPATTYDVAGVVDAYRQAGGRVELTIDGEPGALPASAQVTVYRFVQEALTNIGRHGDRDATAQLSLRIRRGAVSAEARNRLPAQARSGAAPPAGHSGNGLRGMGERVAALGGELRSGRQGGSWVTSCTLPLGPNPDAAP